MDTRWPAPSAASPTPQTQLGDTDSAVPVQTITFSSDPAMKPVATAQLSVASFQKAEPNSDTSEEGWIIDVHGDVLFNLQMQVIDAVQATFRITSIMNSLKPIGATATDDIHNGNDACYSVDVNGTRIVDHERCNAFRDWHDHDVEIPANVLQVGDNSLLLSVSDRGGSKLGLRSLTVQSGSSAA